MAKLSVVKVTLSTGKVVLLRQMKISDTETAAQMVAQKAGDNANLLQLFMQKALVQVLIVKVNDQTLSGIDKEGLDDLFDVNEYSQVLKVVGKMAGGDNSGKEPTVEFAPEDSQQKEA